MRLCAGSVEQCSKSADLEHNTRHPVSEKRAGVLGYVICRTCGGQGFRDETRYFVHSCTGHRAHVVRPADEERLSRISREFKDALEPPKTLVPPESVPPNCPAPPDAMLQHFRQIRTDATDIGPDDILMQERHISYSLDQPGSQFDPASMRSLDSSERTPLQQQQQQQQIDHNEIMEIDRRVEGLTYSSLEFLKLVRELCISESQAQTFFIVRILLLCKSRRKFVR